MEVDVVHMAFLGEGVRWDCDEPNVACCVQYGFITTGNYCINGSINMASTDHWSNMSLSSRELIQYHE